MYLPRYMFVVEELYFYCWENNSIRRAGGAGREGTGQVAALPALRRGRGPGSKGSERWAEPLLLAVVALSLPERGWEKAAPTRFSWPSARFLILAWGSPHIFPPSYWLDDREKMRDKSFHSLLGLK